VRQAIETGELQQLDEVLKIVRLTGSLDATRQAAAAEAQRAMDTLALLPRNPFSAALLELASQLLARRA
jgi:octaprenyl-diphosphate synthase